MHSYAHNKLRGSAVTCEAPDRLVLLHFVKHSEGHFGLKHLTTSNLLSPPAAAPQGPSPGKGRPLPPAASRSLQVTDNNPEEPEKSCRLEAGLSRSFQAPASHLTKLQCHWFPQGGTGAARYWSNAGTISFVTLTQSDPHFSSYRETHLAAMWQLLSCSSFQWPAVWLLSLRKFNPLHILLQLSHLPPGKGGNLNEVLSM